MIDKRKFNVIELKIKSKSFYYANKDRIISIIPTGKENAISTQELCMIFDAKENVIREAIKYIRLLDTYESFICSCQNGYYYPESDFEWIEFIRCTRSRRDTTNRILMKAESFMNDMNVNKKGDPSFKLATCDRSPRKNNDYNVI